MCQAFWHFKWHFSFTTSTEPSLLSSVNNCFLNRTLNDGKWRQRCVWCEHVHIFFERNGWVTHWSDGASQCSTTIHRSSMKHERMAKNDVSRWSLDFNPVLNNSIRITTTSNSLSTDISPPHSFNTTLEPVLMQNARNNMMWSWAEQRASVVWSNFRK